MADLKSFLTCDEDGTVESRYNDTKMPRNQMRAYASNDLAQEKNVYNAGDTLISETASLVCSMNSSAATKRKMSWQCCNAPLSSCSAATLSTFVCRVNVRDAIVHRICLEDVHLDLLCDRDKPLYGKYKGGTMETGPNFD